MNAQACTNAKNNNKWYGHSKLTLMGTTLYAGVEDMRAVARLWKHIGWGLQASNAWMICGVRKVSYLAHC